MKELIEFIPVATYGDEFSLWTGPHGPRTYSSLPSALKWRKQHGRENDWKILKLTLVAGQEPRAEWVA
ncbi:hypothetical protein PBI_MYXUS_41 [Mycobacterium phage Myxus]|uniref:Uncharacterized protein n=9 Tax=Fromanvirus TaxID=186764 RepID=A0A142K4U9_9CAUD|nr:hypothetical protein AVV05_gp068 [Mycobacterium phage Pioneer]YP_009301864.1 hypothetical protein BJD80_gp069 [Mycobacterium phage Catalina]YP_009636010.1 hypothetical protein FGG56_gp63 [Mycobacterium phage PackMan]AMO43909.1 hypothetical protein PBI_MYXUS_41 [Mycobacterium phage Myxus]AMS00841.1 hypothetical protein PBI_EIDSMOE_41 [Mycobacterium phage Eidsmoe]AOQ28997.1 hypothetical protein SEA_HORTUMSL17_41 [Mycobacterium phage HortumSL17]AOT26159.1 hypothetical protein SEA_QOBBIT_41 [M